LLFVKVGENDMSDTTRVDHVQTYGKLAVIAGLALSAGLICYEIKLGYGKP